MAKTYQVTAPCVTHVPVGGAAGLALDTFYQGAILPAEVPADRIKHLLDSNLIEEVGADAQPEGVAPEGNTPPRTVTSRSSKAELVDYGAAQGDDRKELEELTRDQLLDRYRADRP